MFGEESLWKDSLWGDGPCPTSTIALALSDESVDTLVEVKRLVLVFEPGRCAIWCASLTVEPSLKSSSA